ncbi:hypothetical protein CRG98_019591 [Punica granatum]|uniref:KIB1-4 beta-propeller domain-containing protein n=1 Tax=Punica granatum TaxID=22663 RepID=A0A2I0JVX3_PUNGR|nr:hypothetical protein CRG98_019591 [Punica granatum]
MAESNDFDLKTIVEFVPRSKSTRWYDIIQNRIGDSRLLVPYNGRCCGSSHGWLIFTEENLALTLYNPFTGKSIHLPPVIPVPSENERALDYDYQHEIPKVVLSADPLEAPDTYEVVAIYNICVGKLAYFKSGWSTWIYARQSKHRRALSFHFYDITCFNGKFYAANGQWLASLEVCIGEAEPNASYIRLNHVAVRDFNEYQYLIVKCYIVGSPDGRLVWIDRHNRRRRAGKKEYFDINGSSYEFDPDRMQLTSRFKVYEMKEIDGEMKHVELRKLEGQAIFVGHNHSEMILTKILPECKPNRIHYTDDCMDRIDGPYKPLGAVDIGVFDLEKERIESLYVPGPSKRDVPPPIWFVPRANHIVN